MVEEIEGYHMKWRNCVERMPSEHLPREAYFHHPVGRWDIGHPGRRWAQFLLS
jgi:hypothetical protein